MIPRSLPVLNTIGCLVLAAVVFTQWTKESRTDAAMTKLLADFATANTQLETEINHATNLERDITVLKQSLEATQRAAIEAADNEKKVRTGIKEERAAAREQIDRWKSSIAERDEKIRILNAHLIATRRRLDEAIVKLKQAGAR